MKANGVAWMLGALTVMSSLGCDRAVPSSGKSIVTEGDGCRGRSFEGVRVSIDESSWPEFSRSWVVVRLRADDICEVDGVQINGEKDAFALLTENLLQKSAIGVVVFRTKREFVGEMSLESIKKLCTERNIDCLVNNAIGGGEVLPLGTKPPPKVDLLWAIGSGCNVRETRAERKDNDQR